LNHFTVPVAIAGCPFTAGCMRAAPQNGRGLGVDHLDGVSLNMRPAVRSETAQSSGQRSMDVTMAAEQGLYKPWQNS
jgi:hypothetical protein